MLDDWKIEKVNRPWAHFHTIRITAPNGYSTVVSSLDRNPENILYMLALDILKARDKQKGPAHF